ncbi:MAG TPA: DNA-binding domain-containing protein [Planctomycetota bacterium]|nr:DNA-binding domain-containing protein [Planctomycetota bacterium]
MSALAAFQRQFMEMLFAPAPPGDARLAIYHGAVRANWSRALAAAYPVARRMVGEAFFDAAAEAYGLAHPSRSGDLGAFGERFADFLAAHGPAAPLAYLPDVARLEWAVHGSACAADVPPFDFTALGRVPAERHGAVRLRLHPAVRLLESAHPVVAIWEANQPGRDGTPARLEGAERVLVARRGFDPLPRALAPAEWALLDGLARGCTLDEACSALGEEAGRLQPMLVALAGEGVVCGFDAPG